MTIKLHFASLSPLGKVAGSPFAVVMVLGFGMLFMCTILPLWLIAVLDGGTGKGGEA